MPTTPFKKSVGDPDVATGGGGGGGEGSAGAGAEGGLGSSIGDDEQSKRVQQDRRPRLVRVTVVRDLPL